MSYKRGLAVVFACAIASAVVFAATYHRFFAPLPAPAHAAAGASAPAVASAPGTPLAIDFPPLVTDHNPLSWAHLTPAQHAALSPFAAVWDRFSDERKRKWIKIASGFAKMSPERQKRLHEQMAQWVRMTPEQRRVARENYQLSKALPPQARQKAWTAYQQLSPEQKARLAASERKRRPTVVSAPPSGAKSEIRGLNRLVEPPPGAGSNVAAATGASAPVAVPAQPGATAPASAAPAKNAPLSPSEDESGIFKGA